jgi:hypothetical protein
MVESRAAMQEKQSRLGTHCWAVRNKPGALYVEEKPGTVDLDEHGALTPVVD